MKKLLSTLFILVLLSVTFFVPQAHATSEQPPVTVVLLRNETINRDYFAAGDTVTVSGTVNGDAYIAGGTVVIDGTINGDLLVAAGTVQLNGPVKNDVRAIAGAIIFSNAVGGNVTLGTGTATVSPEARITGSVLAGAGTLDIYGSVGKGITAGSGNITINNKVGGDVMVAAEMLSFLPKSNVSGDVTYWSENEASVASGVVMAGDLVRHELPKQEEPKVIGKKGMLAGATMFGGFAFAGVIIAGLTLFVLGLILKALLPKFTERSVSLMQKNPWGSFGLGIVTVIMLPILAVTAMITVIGFPIGLFLLMMLSILCLVGHIYAAFFIGKGILTKSKAEVHHAWHLLVGLVVLGIFTLIPILGWLAKGIFVLIGTGAILFEKNSVYRQMRLKHLV